MKKGLLGHQIAVDINYSDPVKASESFSSDVIKEQYVAVFW